MPFHFFPNEDYVLNSPCTPTGLIDILSANITGSKKAATLDNKGSMGPQYFEGEINKFNSLRFRISYNSSVYFSAINRDSKPYPVYNGTITESKNGSVIHIVTNWPLGLYLYIICFLFFPVFLLIISFSKVVTIFLLTFLIVLFLSIQHQYKERLRIDKEKIKDIFKVER